MIDIKYEDILINSLKLGIKELRTENYQLDKNGLSQALQLMVEDLEKIVKNNVVLDDVSKR